MASWIFDTTLPTTTMNSTLIKTVMDRLYGVSGIPTASTASFTKVLPRILDFFLPGYGFICNSLIDTLGIDINFVLWIVVGFYTLTRLKKVFLIMMAPLMGQFIYKFTFDSDSRAYESFMSWANKHEIGLGQRNVQLEGFDSTWDVSNALKDFDPLSDKAIRTHPQRIKLMPSFGTHWFWYKRSLFRFVHVKREMKEGHDIIDASLSCIGLSTEPLKVLFLDLLESAHQNIVSHTRIHWPASKQRRSDESGRSWRCIISRESRPMSTVILETTLKLKVLWDMAEFLNQETARWYSQRGLPYRRGYLFSGAPGTGKTSISFAIAGIFRLPIYVLSLQDPTISENDLMVLFNDLPWKCVMILEDIDSAGIRNRGKSIQSKRSEGVNSSDKDAVDDETDSRISLSGLLNVIDGIASTEGRILIMTTNAVETLDPALVRPGRIDMVINFELLTQADARELFILMYQGSASCEQHSKTKVVDPSVLANLAERFAKQIPDKVFSPAEVQGYLLMEKHNPESAVEGFQTWIFKTQEQKKADKQRRKELEQE